MSYRSNKTYLDNPDDVVRGTISRSGTAGKVLWTDDQGTLSIQPNGDIQYRPAGTDGPWEQATLSGTRLVYDAGVPRIFDVTV